MISRLNSSPALPPINALRLSSRADAPDSRPAGDWLGLPCTTLALVTPYQFFPALLSLIPITRLREREALAFALLEFIDVILEPDFHRLRPSTLEGHGQRFLCYGQLKPVAAIANAEREPMQRGREMRIEPEDFIAHLKTRVAALHQINRSRHGS